MVITIIAVLAIVGITAFSGAQASARDGRRRQDIDSIASAMETHYNAVAGTYAALDGTFFASGTVPTDPDPNAVYPVNLTNGSKGFNTCASLENKNGNSSNGNSNPATPPAYSVASANGYYCKSSQQSQ